MGSATVVWISQEEAKKERAELLEHVGMSLERLRERAAEYTLSDEEFLAWERIEDLTWLLGE